MNRTDLKKDVKLGIASRLRLERERLGLTQTQLSAELGVTRFTISNYESGERMPTADQLHFLSEKGVDVSFLITGVHSLSTSEGQKRFFKTLNGLREYCRLSKMEVPEDEITKAAIYLAEGSRVSNDGNQTSLLGELKAHAIQSVFESL